MSGISAKAIPSKYKYIKAGIFCILTLPSNCNILWSKSSNSTSNCEDVELPSKLSIALMVGILTIFPGINILPALS